MTLIGAGGRIPRSQGRLAVYWHFDRLTEDALAHPALSLAMNARSRCQSPQRRCPRSGPRHSWLRQIHSSDRI